MLENLNILTIDINTLKNCMNMTGYGFRCDPCTRRVRTVLDKLNERINKYTIRGFTIDIEYMNGIYDLEKLTWQAAEAMDK